MITNQKIDVLIDTVYWHTETRESDGLPIIKRRKKLRASLRKQIKEMIVCQNSRARKRKK